MAARFFGRGEQPKPMPGHDARSYPIAAMEARDLPLADVVKAMDDERAARRLRRRMRWWRLFRRVR
jgi:hypothetical protein